MQPGTKTKNMEAQTKVEFDVEMKCERCAEKIKSALTGAKGIQSFDVNLDSRQVIVEGTLNSNTLKQMIESTGTRAVLKGMGGTSNTGSSHLGAAVSMMQIGRESIKGLIRLVQTNEQTCVIEGTVDGLPPGYHGLFVHELGDISEGCQSCGDVFNTRSGQRPTGDMGNILAGPNGRAEFRLVNENLKVWDLIGRSMVVHSSASDTAVKKDNSGDERLVCGIIARSAGLFENAKKLCACDGVTQWDERYVPVAGPDRQQAKM